MFTNEEVAAETVVCVLTADAGIFKRSGGLCDRDGDS